MKKFILVLLLSITAGLVTADISSAASLKIQPLLYKETLAKGEKKKGFIDISNPLSQPVVVHTSVQAFRQTDNNGSLQFFDNEQVRAGIIPDLTEFELGPREAIRMYFLVDGTKLPEGDVFGAIFVSTKPGQEARGLAQGIRVGTLFTVVNGTPGARQAAVESISLPTLQTGSAVKGSFKIKNTADEKAFTGFYPQVKVSVTPIGQSKEISAPLVMAGRSREVAFEMPGDRLGVYKVTAAYSNSEQSQWVLVATGYWQWLAPLLLAVSGLAAWLLLRRRRSQKKYFRA